MAQKMEFETALSDTDYGLIVGKDGRLKGIWIPSGYEDEEIPDTIVALCIQRFGIDPNGAGHHSVLQ
jgi:hypothetical protein